MVEELRLNRVLEKYQKRIQVVDLKYQISQRYFR